MDNDIDDRPARGFRALHLQHGTGRAWDVPAGAAGAKLRRDNRQG